MRRRPENNGVQGRKEQRGKAGKLREGGEKVEKKSEKS